MKYIESKKNDEIKNVIKLSATKNIKKTGTYVVEGFHLVREADLNNEEFVSLYVTTPNVEDRLVKKYHEIATEISTEVATAISETKNNQGIFAVIKINQPEEISSLSGQWVFLDNVQDPGNVGTIVRTADAAGFAGVISSPNSADFFQSKVQRAMQGSQFHLPIYKMNLDEAIDLAKDSGLHVYGSEVNSEAVPYNEIQKNDNFALIMGNEANGMSQDLLDQTDDNVYIPILGKAESLNVAIAAGILMYGLKGI
ncbi:TrmH family RNA methyltransferase [Lactobacillus terrae]|uniref:TrmH family RNA methyltransferase n=1 Tax=Lactobacillus terrae TaxID=2269374 RepID=UPI000C1B6428|nr:RNA methyltransferase [Lactobacillus terrae]